MRSKLMLLFLAVILTLGVTAAADNDNNEKVEPEDIKLAIVDFWHARDVVSEERVEGLSYQEVEEAAREKGYELVVNYSTIELYIDGILSEVSDLTDSNATEEVKEAIIKGEDYENPTDPEEVEELKQLEWITIITEDVIEWFSSN